MRWWAPYLAWWAMRQEPIHSALVKNRPGFELPKYDRIEKVLAFRNPSVVLLSGRTRLAVLSSILGGDGMEFIPSTVGFTGNVISPSAAMALCMVLRELRVSGNNHFRRLWDER